MIRALGRYFGEDDVRKDESNGVKNDGLSSGERELRIQDDSMRRGIQGS